MEKIKKTLFVLLIIGAIFLSACDTIGNIDLSKLSDKDLERIGKQLIVCDSPYIRHEAGCCIDNNNNKICDNDETSLKKIDEVKTKYTNVTTDVKTNRLNCDGILFEESDNNLDLYPENLGLNINIAIDPDALAEETIAMTSIVTNLKFREYGYAQISINDLSFPLKNDLIIIGVASNPFISCILEKDDITLQNGEGMVKIYKSNDIRHIILVTGQNAMSVRLSANVLTNIEDYPFNSNFLRISKTSNNNIKVVRG